MPYDLSFKRLAPLDNETAFQCNLDLAQRLLQVFPEIVGPTQIKPNEEFPELHLYLEAETDEFFFFFSFWKDAIYIELGAGGDIRKRFELVWNYSERITENGFLLTDPNGDGLLGLGEGLLRHLEEYKAWVGYVDFVQKKLSSEK